MEVTQVRTQDCELCIGCGGEPIWEDNLCRVVRVADVDYPNFCRVIWNRHVREMTDLPASERRHLMPVVFSVETALRRFVHPGKINLASLGNLTPHLHWHVIPCFSDDRHYPNPVWGEPQHTVTTPQPVIGVTALRSAIIEALAEEHSG